MVKQHKKKTTKPRSQKSADIKGIDQDCLFDTYTTPGHLIRRLQQAVVGLYYEKLLDTGVTPVQFTSMMAIRRFPGTDQRRLAQLVALDRSTIGSVLERLEKRGLITRKILPDDKRHKAIFITHEGARLLRKMQPVVQEVQVELLATLTSSERATFNKLLAKLVDVNNESSRAPLKLSGPFPHD